MIYFLIFLGSILWLIIGTLVVIVCGRYFYLPTSDDYRGLMLGYLILWPIAIIVAFFILIVFIIPSFIQEKTKPCDSDKENGVSDGSRSGL